MGWRPYVHLIFGTLGITASLIAFSFSFSTFSPGINSPSTVKYIIDEFDGQRIIGLASSVLAIALCMMIDLIVSIYVKLVCNPAHDFRSRDQCLREWVGMFLHIIAPAMSALPLVFFFDEELKYRLYVYSFYAENFVAIMASFFTITNKHERWNLKNGLVVQTLYFASIITLFITDHMYPSKDLYKTSGYAAAVVLLASSFLYYCYLLICTFQDIHHQHQIAPNAATKDFFHSIICPTVALSFFYQSFVTNFIDTGKESSAYIISCQLLSIFYLVVNTIGPSTLSRYEIMSTSFTAIKYASDTRHTIKQSLIEPLREIQYRISQLGDNEFFEDQVNQRHLDKLDMVFNYVILQLKEIDLNSKIVDIMGEVMDSDTASMTESRLSIADSDLLSSLSIMLKPDSDEQLEIKRPLAPLNISDSFDDYITGDAASTCTSNYLVLDSEEKAKFERYTHNYENIMDVKSSGSESSVESATIDVPYYSSIINGTTNKFVPITAVTVLDETSAVDDLCDFISHVGFTQASEGLISNYHARPMHLFRQHEQKICNAYNKYISSKIKELTDMMEMASALIAHVARRDQSHQYTRFSRHDSDRYNKSKEKQKPREVSLVDMVQASGIISTRISHIISDYHAFLSVLKKEN